MTEGQSSVIDGWTGMQAASPALPIGAVHRAPLGAMVSAAAAFLATLATFGCAGLLVMRTLPDRRIHLINWCGTLAALGIALGAMLAGFAMGFSPALLRTMALFGALLAPVTLALGVVELIGRTVQARFAGRLIAASYTVVAVVIILLDPISGTFGKTLPEISGHYSSLPQLVLDGGHVFAVVALLSCVGVTAVRGNRRDRQATEMMLPLGLVALAGVLVVAATRGFLPGPLAPLALGGAAGLVWFGAARLLPGRPADDDDEDAEPYDDMAHYPGQPQRHPHHGQPYQGPRGAAQHPGGRPAHGVPQQAPQPSFTPPPMPFGLPGQYGRITMYTLIDGHQEAFDRLAAEVTRAVIQREPGTLVYACHSVDNAPTQRIFYQLFRDAAAVEEHTRQPHVQRFAGEARAHVAGTNVIELTANAAKVAGPPAGPAPAVPRPAAPQDGRGAQSVRWPHG